ncbi:uncharacterized protein E0L32_004965 [Thyridium curvatum]|uniref:DUF718 domain protein n=1 Tax=Thyridium curvatum TaxID=1093900 RepID=A0A507B6V6_9PEZI|nr:uncharacterized protein E0L32_004965 [Thyridium curvatum]TPX14856.1 hypothetical protein E0L32_004965 [Thyridium curvatum]
MWSKPSAAPADHTPEADALTPATIRQKNHGRRYGQVVRLKPEHAARYKEVHAAVWPEVLKQIKDCNIKDYSIFYDEASGMLFACFKYVGYDFAGDMERMRENPRVREWWKMTDGFQESLVPGATCSEAEPPAPGWWRPIEEVFYTP